MSYAYTVSTSLGRALGATSIPSPTLVWLIQALIIIGIALFEGIKMMDKHGEQYQQYRDKTPFLLPLSGLLSKVIIMLIYFFLEKNYPENIVEVVLVLILYAVILIAASTILVLLI